MSIGIFSLVTLVLLAVIGLVLFRLTVPLAKALFSISANRGDDGGRVTLKCPHCHQETPADLHTCEHCQQDL